MKTAETVYGLHAVRVMLERHPERVLSVRLSERRDDPRVRRIEELARQHNRPVQRVDAQALKQMLGDVAHQGVVAEVVPMPGWTEDTLLAALASPVGAGPAPALASRAGAVLAAAPASPAGAAAAPALASPVSNAPLLLALDGVQDPHNLGACLRTADACGALAVVVPKDRAAQMTPTVRKVAAGAAETTPVVAVTNLVRTLKLLKDAGLWIVGADAEGPRMAHEVDLKVGTVLVLGAEGAGLRLLTRQTCDWVVRLPSLGAVESLNVSVAAGMLLYEVVRQRAVKP